MFLIVHQKVCTSFANFTVNLKEEGCRYIQLYSYLVYITVFEIAVQHISMSHHT